MPYNTAQIKKDYDGKPIPQYYSPITDSYEALHGRNGANRIEIYGPDGNPLSVISGKLAVRVTEVESLLGSGLPAVLTAGGGVKTGLVDAIPTGSNTIGSVKTAGNDALLQGNIILSGAAQQLTSNQASRIITIQAEPSNTGYVYVGKSDVSDTIHMATLSPGSSMTFYVGNLNLLYVRGTSGDKVCYGGEV